MKIPLFDFLGYTFRPRHAKNKYGKFFTEFLPAKGVKVKKSVGRVVQKWKLQLKPDIFRILEKGYSVFV